MIPIALAEHPFFIYKQYTYFYPVWSSDFLPDKVIPELEEIAYRYYEIYPFCTGKGTSAIAPYDLFYTHEEIIREAQRLPSIDGEWLYWFSQNLDNAHLRCAGKYKEKIRPLPFIAGSGKLHIINNLSEKEIKVLGDMLIRKRMSQLHIKFPEGTVINKVK